MRYFIEECANVVLIRDTHLKRYIGDGKGEELLCESWAHAESIVEILKARVGA